MPIDVHAQQNYTIDDIVVKIPSDRKTSSRPLMSFVEGISAWVPYSSSGSVTSITLSIHKDGCTTATFNISVPSTSNFKYFLPTSALYPSEIYLAYHDSSNQSSYNYTNIGYTVSGCTITLSTTTPTWNNISDYSLTAYDAPIWLEDRKYLLGRTAWDYDTKTKISVNGGLLSVTQSTYFRNNNVFVGVGFYGSPSPLYYCIMQSNTITCNSTTTTYSHYPRVLGYIYYSDSNILYVYIQHGSNSMYDVVLINFNTNTTERIVSNSNIQLPYGLYGTSYNYNLGGYSTIFVPLINSNGSTSAIIYYEPNSFKYYRTHEQAYNDIKAPIGDLTQNPYYQVLVLLNNSFGNIVNIFDQNFNLLSSFNLTGLSTSTYYTMLKFPANIKYMQVYNTSTNQSIIFKKANSFAPSTHISDFYEPFQTTVVMTPITFSRLDTDTNYYYVEVAQNRPYKPMTQYYAKVIDQSSQVTIALRQAQCSYLVLHEINKSSLEESTLNFMVCEDGISKTIEVPNTVNFVYAQDAIFKIHKNGTNDFNIGISSNKDINSEVKVTVCDVIDRALYDFENSTNEGVQITPNDVTITYPALSANERAMKVYKNASGTYEYVFPLVRVNRNYDLYVYVELSPQDIGGDTKDYDMQFLLKQYNSIKQLINDITILEQTGYSGFSTNIYGNYTAYYKTLAITSNSLDSNTDYVQLVLRFTTSSAPYYNHLIQVYIDTNVNQRVCHNYALFTSMTTNTIYTIEDNVRSILDKEIIIQYNNQLYSNTFYVNNKTSYSSTSSIESTFSNKIKGVFDEFSTKLTGNTDMSIVLFLAFMSIMFFSTIITRNIAVMYAIFILIVSITAYIYNTAILTMPALIILAFMAIALAIYYRYR